MTNFSLAGICSLVMAIAATALADAVKGDAMESLDTIRERWEDRSATDAQVVHFLTRQLDARLAAWQPLTEQQGYEIATLLRLIARRPYPAEPQERPDAVRGAIAANDRGLRSPDLTHDYLGISLGLAGEAPRREAIERFLAPKDVPPAVQVVALEAVARSGIDRWMLPQIAALLDDPYRILDQASDVGPPDPRFVYPVRMAACRALDAAGVPCRTKLSPPREGESYPTLDIEINRDTLESLVEESENESENGTAPN